MGRAATKKLPDYDLLHKFLVYWPDTGVLLWKKQEGDSPSIKGFNNKCGGKIAGTLLNGRKDEPKYLVVGIRENGVYRQYLAHRIIWKMMTGDDPIEQIDHVNGSRVDNRWANLRPATNGQNIQNSKLRRDNKTGVKGVAWDSKHQKWRAVIAVNGKARRIGRYKTLELAAQAIAAERSRLHGEFAREV
jgi:hypothetical protein